MERPMSMPMHQQHQHYQPGYYPHLHPQFAQSPHQPIPLPHGFWAALQGVVDTLNRVSTMAECLMRTNTHVHSPINRHTGFNANTNSTNSTWPISTTTSTTPIPPLSPIIKPHVRVHDDARSAIKSEHPQQTIRLLHPHPLPTDHPYFKRKTNPRLSAAVKPLGVKAPAKAPVKAPAKAPAAVTSESESEWKTVASTRASTRDRAGKPKVGEFKQHPHRPQIAAATGGRFAVLDPDDFVPDDSDIDIEVNSGRVKEDLPAPNTTRVAAVTTDTASSSKPKPIPNSKPNPKPNVVAAIGPGGKSSSSVPSKPDNTDLRSAKPATTAKTATTSSSDNSDNSDDGHSDNSDSDHTHDNAGAHIDVRGLSPNRRADWPRLQQIFSATGEPLSPETRFAPTAALVIIIAAYDGAITRTPANKKALKSIARYVSDHPLRGNVKAMEFFYSLEPSPYDVDDHPNPSKTGSVPAKHNKDTDSPASAAAASSRQPYVWNIEASRERYWRPDGYDEAHYAEFPQDRPKLTKPTKPMAAMASAKPVTSTTSTTSTTSKSAAAAAAAAAADAKDDARPLATGLYDGWPWGVDDDDDGEPAAGL